MSQSQEDFIDLRNVFKKIEGFFSGIIQFIKNGMNRVLNRKLYYSAWILAGIGAGVLYYKTTKKEYESKLLMQSHIMTNAYCSKLITTLEDLISEDNNKELALKLGISEQKAAAISDLKYKKYVPKYGDIEALLSSDDSLTENSPFIIVATVYDNSILDSLEIGILNYLEKNPYGSKRQEVKMKNLTDLSTKVSNQISQIDSLKSTIKESLVNKGKSSQGIVLMQQSIDPLNTYREVIELYTKQLDMSGEIAISKSVEVLEGFTKFKKPSHPRALISVAAFCSLFFLLGLLVDLRKEFDV